MRLLMRLLGLLLVLAVVLIGLAFVLPDRVHVERSITIARPQSQIYLLLSNLRRFNEWSPWFAKDPAARYTFSGPDGAVGAKLAWSSQKPDVGEGSQTVVALKPNESVALELDFGDMGKSNANFRLATVSNETRVTWSLDSELPLNLDSRFAWNVVGRYMGLFMDRLVGRDFEDGLARLRELAGSFPTVDIAGLEPRLVELPARKLIAIATTASSGDEAALKRSWDVALAQLQRFIAQHHLEATGAPLSLTRQRDANQWQFDLAVPAQYDLMPEDTAVRGVQLPPSRAVQLDHFGSLSERVKVIEKLEAWIVVKGFTAAPPVVEEYAPGVGPGRGEVRISIPLQTPAPN
jgi:hypothetical protein